VYCLLAWPLNNASRSVGARVCSMRLRAMTLRGLAATNGSKRGSRSMGWPPAEESLSLYPYWFSIRLTTRWKAWYEAVKVMRDRISVEKMDRALEFALRGKAGESAGN